MNIHNNDIVIVVPLYNEEKTLEPLVKRLKIIINEAKFSIQVVLINDGSTDKTQELIDQVCNEDSNFKGIVLSRNYGHQIAVSAGLRYSNPGKGVLIIDGDLQDPPELIHDFYDLLVKGYDVVYAVRKNRKESFLKRICYKLYYRLQQRISNFEIPIDSGDFSMLSARVVHLMNNMPEQDRYLRGIRAWVGFKQIGFEYERQERYAGNSKYTWGKLIQLAFKGIFNFSDFPIRFITRLGLITIVFSLIYFGYNLYRKIFYNDIPQGFTATILAIILFSGVQLISLGIIGEYVLRIYNQVKQRPLFIVDRTINIE
ncbi:MAG TPA: glycosyltransferase family 2 protein [Flavobacterium sp.]|nr:glycosyltransferase family 2 protein [Flavobacterium sp.]